MNTPLINQARQSLTGEIAVKNAATVSLAKKTPIVFAMNGTSDGFAIVRPSDTAAAQALGLPAGILLEDLAVSQIGRSKILGILDDAKYVIRTRAGTTGSDVWATRAAISIGQPLVIDTVNNALVTGTQHAAHLPAFCAVETVATVATLDTSTGDTATVSTGSIKVFVRVMG